MLSIEEIIGILLVFLVVTWWLSRKNEREESAPAPDDSRGFVPHYSG